jgi:hypothetical protein
VLPIRALEVATALYERTAAPCTVDSYA